MPRAGNNQRDFAELIDMQGHNSSDKNYLNILKCENLRKRDKPSKKNSDRWSEIPQQKIEVWWDKEKVADAVKIGIQDDVKIVKDQKCEIKVGKQQDNKIIVYLKWKTGAGK